MHDIQPEEADIRFIKYGYKYNTTKKVEKESIKCELINPYFFG